jgi:hypothetical protein
LFGSLAILAALPGGLQGDDEAPARTQFAADAVFKPPAPRRAISLRWENDTFAGRDEDYSNGISLALAHEGRGLLGGIWPWFGARDGRWVSGYELGQIIVTPTDINRSIPDPNDRPYAGLLYGALSTQFSHDNQLHGLKLIVGVVGPASLAEETQTWAHRQIGSGEPQGWDYQLKNEPIFNLVYEHRRRYDLLRTEDGWGAQFIPTAGGMLGNVLIQAQAGGQLRFGYHLLDDFGTTLMRGLGNLPCPQAHRGGDSARSFGAYLFAGGGANLVARNLTLDGSTFRDSPSVDKEPFFAAGEFGVSVWLRPIQATFSYVLWGKEFEGQKHTSQFAAVTATVYF